MAVADVCKCSLKIIIYKYYSRKHGHNEDLVVTGVKIQKYQSCDLNASSSINTQWELTRKRLWEE